MAMRIKYPNKRLNTVENKGIEIIFFDDEAKKTAPVLQEYTLTGEKSKDKKILDIIRGQG